MIKFILLFIVMHMIACQTIPKHIQIDLPTFLYEHIHKCQDVDGSLDYQLEHRAMSLTLAGELDWSSSKSDWDIQVVDGLGAEIATIRWADNRLKFAGTLVDYGKELTVANDGALYFKGYFIGFYADELPCLLKAKIPMKWKNLLTHFQNKSNELMMDFADESRTINSAIQTNLKDSKMSFCANVRWSHMFGLKSDQINWCFKVTTNGRSSSSLTHESGLKAQWISNE